MRTVLFFIVASLTTSLGRTADPLPSWNETGPKAAILSFVDLVTTEGSREFVPIPERIATFDNDGTLWAEQPMYVQAYFVLDRIHALALEHPEWSGLEPFASVLKGDMRSVLARDEKGLLELVMATHAGMTAEEFERIVIEWVKSARHPETGKLFTDMVYQPMLELLTFLRERGFKTFIVSGGGIEFIRPWSERVYGIPPEQVIGSSVKMRYEVRDGKPVIARLPELNFIDDRAGKPIGIQLHVGRRPLMAFGNSDGDFQMLEWTMAGDRAGFGLLVHHTDKEREWAYDRVSHVGRLDMALDEGRKRGWTVVSMKEDWAKVYRE